MPPIVAGNIRPIFSAVAIGLTGYDMILDTMYAILVQSRHEREEQSRAGE